MLHRKQNSNHPHQPVMHAERPAATWHAPVVWPLIEAAQRLASRSYRPTGTRSLICVYTNH